MRSACEKGEEKGGELCVGREAVYVLGDMRGGQGGACAARCLCSWATWPSLR